MDFTSSELFFFPYATAWSLEYTRVERSQRDAHKEASHRIQEARQVSVPVAQRTTQIDCFR